VLSTFPTPVVYMDALRDVLCIACWVYTTVGERDRRAIICSWSLYSLACVLSPDHDGRRTGMRTSFALAQIRPACSQPYPP